MFVFINVVMLFLFFLIQLELLCQVNVSVRRCTVCRLGAGSLEVSHQAELGVLVLTEED